MLPTVRILMSPCSVITKDIDVVRIDAKSCRTRSSRTMSYHLTRQVASHQVTARHVTSRHVTSRHITSRHVTSRHVTSRHGEFASVRNADGVVLLRCTVEHADLVDNSALDEGIPAETTADSAQLQTRSQGVT